jgi:hypothetical protein
VIEDRELLAAIDARREDAAEVMRFVHDHPELGHEERQCSAFVAERLDAAGFDVDRAVGGMETAFRATLRGSRPAGPSASSASTTPSRPCARTDESSRSIHADTDRSPAA